MIFRARGRHVFAALRSEGVRVRSGAVRMTHLARETPHPELAFAIGRKFGNAVERNRARRRLRSAFADAWSPRSAEGRVAPGVYLVTASRGVLVVPYTELVGDVGRCLDRAHEAGLATAPVPVSASNGGGR